MGNEKARKSEFINWTQNYSKLSNKTRQFEIKRKYRSTSYFGKRKIF